ncbi:MAG: PDZ domain-containing protein [Deltaproteobacteria bacterium]|nr:PDZ domain-containing protein [Deltaproteobacteria bacterium]
MENGKLKNQQQPGVFRRGRVWKVVAIFLILAAALYWQPLYSAGPVQGYDSLRLLTEALYEISQKFVYQKSEDEMMDGALRGMMNSLDPDSSFLSPLEYKDLRDGKKGQVAEAGVELIFKDHLLTVASALDNGPAYRTGLRQGDHILKVNGHLVRNLTGQEAARRFQGPPNTAIKLQVIRNGVVKPLDFTVTLEPLTGSSVNSQMVGDSLGYIRIGYFNDATHRDLASAIKALQRQPTPLRGVVLDLRNNARGTLEQGVRSASVWLGDKQIISTKGRIPETTQAYQGKVQDLAWKSPVPVVVLIDPGTARAAEVMAAALKDQAGAVLLGEKSLGLCGLNRLMPLPDGSALIMTVAQCYTVQGHKIQGKGLEPDIPGKKLTAPVATSKDTPKPPSPDQDPWVIQAVEILKSGKPPKLAHKGDS